MFATLSALSEPFSSSANMTNIARNFAFIGIVALGQTLVIITAGIDLSVGSVMGVAGVATAVIMGAGYNIWFGVGGGLAVSLMFGFFNGYLIAKFRISAFVVTLGSLSIARSLSMAITEGRPLWQFGPDEKLFFALGGSEFLGLASPVWIMIALGVILTIALKFTAWGKHVFALGSNEQAAELTGVPTVKVKISVYMVAALFAGISGILLTSFLSAVTANLAEGYELRVIASAVIGGANLMGGEGGAYGAIIGALLIEMIRNGLLLLGVNPYWQGTFVGAFIIFAVLLEKIRGRRG
ncbi:MAG: ABC transporter permease [Rhodobacteraceae bacterium]|nr:ABC transporter permease [Paracoccaceae bacterium]